MTREALDFDAFMEQHNPELQDLLRLGQSQAPTAVAPQPVIPSVENTPTPVMGNFLLPIATPIQPRPRTSPNRTSNNSLESWKQSGKNVAAKLGIAALAILGVTGGLVFASDVSHDAPVQVGTTMPANLAVEAPTTTSTVPVTVPETTPVTPPTTEAAPVESPDFSPVPGDIVGHLKFKVTCGEDIIIGEYSELDDVQDKVGHGDSFIDKKIPAVTPNVGCPERSDREKQHEAVTHTNYIGRPDRVRDGHYSSQNTTSDGSALDQSNPSGKVNFWQPLAGHKTSVKGNNIYITPVPGDDGNSVVEGHGSTWNAGFGDIGLLEVGDLGTLNREDGRNFTTQVIEKRVVPVSEYQDTIIKYSNPNQYRATITLSFCTGQQNGDPGTGDQYRTIVRLVVIGEN